MSEAWRFPFGTESGKGFVGVFSTLESAFMRNYITVNASGSIGENCEYTSIVDALTALEAGEIADGSVIFIKAGTYTFTADKTITKSVIITGESGTIFTSDSGTKKLALNGVTKVMDVENITFDTFELEYTAFKTGSIVRCVFTDSAILDVVNSAGGGILTVRDTIFNNSYCTASNYANIISVSGSYFLDYAGSVFQPAGTSPLISIMGSYFNNCDYTSSTGANNVYITSCRILDTTARARSFSFCYIYHNNTTKYGWESLGNSTYNSISQSAIYMMHTSSLQAVYGATSGTFQFMSLYIWSAATTAAYAIDLSSTAETYITHLLLYSANGGIYHHGTNMLYITGSYVYAADLYCLYTTAALVMNIQNNRFYGNADYYPIYLITTGASVGTIQFSGNTVSNGLASYTQSYIIYCNNTTKAGTYMITNNVLEAVDGAEAGILVNNFSQGIIMGNSIPGTTTITNVTTSVNEHNL